MERIQDAPTREALDALNQHADTVQQRTYLRKHRPDLDKVARDAFVAALGIFDAATDDADLGPHPRGEAA